MFELHLAKPVAKELGDCFRAFIKHEDLQESAIEQSIFKKRKQIAREFLDAPRSGEGTHRDHFWPKHGQPVASGWPGETQVQDALADWLFLEVGQRPKRRKKSVPSVAALAEEDRPEYSRLELQTSSGDQLDCEETPYSPEGDIPHGELPSEKALGKRKADAVDIYDFDFDDFLPESDRISDAKTKSTTGKTKNSRPRKLVRFNPSSDGADPAHSISDTEPAQTVASISNSQPREPSELPTEASSSGTTPPTTSTTSAQALSSSSGAPAVGETSQNAARSRAQPSARPEPESNVVVEISREDQQPHRVARDTIGFPAPDSRLNTIFAQVRFLFLDHIEANERAYYDAAHASENLEDVKVALTKAKVLRDLRDELKGPLKKTSERLNASASNSSSRP